ncbi:MAG: DUF86 domain-containing protein [Leptospira sp.]|nr:DUF86 domain-containing protein [Leptospira sp.]
MKNDQLYLAHILQSVNRILEYIAGISETDFDANYLVQDAVIRQLEIIGEATKRLSDELRTANPQIPWKDMAGMRDVLIHDYLNVDLNIVWKTAKQYIPPLKVQIEQLF